MVSGGLMKMADTARKTTSSMKGLNGTLSQSYDEIKRRIQDLESTISKSTSVKQIREARSELEKLQRMANNAPGNTSAKGGGFLSGIVRSILPALGVAGALSLGTSVFSAGAKQEQNIVGLKTFLGQKGAEQAYGNIRKDAAATPFDTESLLMVNRSLISAGLSAQKARQDTLNLANAVSAVGGGNDELSRMAVNMQQIKNIGKATALDIKQFGFAGINIYQLLADATGKSISQVKDMDVSYELLSFALDKAAKKGGLYAGALDAQGKTIAGRWSTLKDTFALGAADIGTALQPLMHNLLDLGMIIANAVVPAVITFVNWIKENWSWISLLVGVIGSAIVAYQAVIWATNLWAAAQTLLNIAMSLNPIGLVIAGIAALVAAIVWAWNKFEGFRQVVWSLWEMFKQVFVNIGSFFKKIFQPIFDAIEAFKDGRYTDAAKHVGKLAYNLSGPGLVVEAVKFAKEGGFTKGMGEAIARGKERGKNKPEAAVSAAMPGGSNLTDAPRPSNLSGGEEAVKGITGGGPRVINVNGVKFTDKVEIHSATVKESAAELQAIFEEMYLRVLNSGAAVQ